MRALLLLIAVLIGYGSLYPFDFTANGDWQREMAALFTDPELRMSRGDLVGNLLLFAPYGFVASVLGHAQPRRASLALLLVLGLLLALVLQLVQLWLPSRVAAMSDVAVNLAGMLLGVAAAGVARRLAPAMTGSAVHGHAPRTHVPAVLMLLWLCYQWFPLVPTLDLQNIINALKPLIHSPRLDIVRTLHTALAWCAFFTLWELSALKQVPRPALAALALCAVGAKVLIVGAAISPANLAGLGIALACLPWLQRAAALPVLAAAMFVSLIASGLAPFTTPGLPQAFHWIPFTGFLEGSMSANVLSLLEKIYFYGALIVLISSRGGRPLSAAIMVAACLGAIEAAQVFIPSHTAESTDPILALLIGMAIRFTERPAPGARH